MALLTIGVPVYNEIDYIAITLENLFEVSYNFPGQIEILVIDNFSTDGTREFLKKIELSRNDVLFQVIYNEINMGFNFSCDCAIKFSSCDYLWIIGGQDIIYKTGLESIISMLDTKPDLIIGNARIRDELTNRIINESLWGDTPSSFFSSIDSFFATLGGPCQAISCNIFNVERTKEVMDQKQVTQLWGFLERLCDLTIKRESSLKIIFYAPPIVEMLIEVKGWQSTGIDNFGVVPRKEYGSFFTNLELAELVNSRFFHRPKIRKSFPLYRDFFAIPRTIIVAKSLGLRISYKLLKRSFIAYKNAPSFYLLGLHFLLFPRCAAIAMVRLKFIVHALRKIFKVKRF